jgi:hypothetical protein
MQDDRCPVNVIAFISSDMNKFLEFWTTGHEWRYNGDRRVCAKCQIEQVRNNPIRIVHSYPVWRTVSCQAGAQ